MRSSVSTLSRLVQSTSILAKSRTIMTTAQDIQTRVIGAANTLDYRVFLESKSTGQPLSPFHDVPL